MEVLSVNIGKRKKINWKSKTVETGIVKKEVNTPIILEFDGVTNDNVVDRKVHGGEDMAVYAFNKNNYKYFEELHPRVAFYNGIFGENLTINGLNETEVFIGDIFKIGQAVIQVSQPRFPCFKLGIVFNTQQIVKQFLESSYCGFYFRVLEVGEVKKGDKVELIEKAKNSMTVAQVYSIYTINKENKELIKKALKLELLATKCKTSLKKRL